MKKLALFLILFSGKLFSQSTYWVPQVLYVASAPSGACSAAPPIQVVISTGTAYTCNNGTWAAISGGGGGGSVTSFSAGTLSPLFTTSVATPTSTPALSFSLTNAAANTAFGNFTGSLGAPSYTATTGTGSPVAATSPTLVTPLLGTPTSGVITNLTGTCTACTANAATTAINLSGGGTITGTPAASVSALFSNPALFSGGNGTTTFPYLFLQPSGATAGTQWNTAGTFLGINSASGFAGNFIDLWLNNATHAFAVGFSGIVYANTGFQDLGNHALLSSAANSLKIYNTGILSWSSTSAYSGTQDTGIDRAAAGVVEVNLGTAQGSGGSIKAQAYLTSGNCAAVGTAASPSVVSCAAASAGAFSCDVAASAATCTINTTAVTANSEIFVQEVADEGTRLSVTCNTAPSVTPAILVATKTAATGFTINMPTITANPACFDYRIEN